MQTINGLDRIGEENAFAVLARAEQLKADGKDVINLGIGQPDFRTPEHIVEAGIKALRDGHHSYTPAPGISALREAVASDIDRRYALEVDPNLVLIVPGGKVTMYLAIIMFGEPGAEIIYPDPGFPIYQSMINFTGATAVALPLHEENGFAISTDDILERLSERTRLIILNSPGNPTGGVTPREQFDALADALEARPDICILSDEIYDQFLFDGREHVTLLSYPQLRDRLILLNGWSKTYAMTGWRIGYAIWPPALFDKARKLAVNCYSCVNASAQWAGLAALEGSQVPVYEMVKEFDRRRQVLVNGLNSIENISCETPHGAFYAFANISQTGWKAKELASALLEQQGVATIGGLDFGPEGEGFIRLSYASSEANIIEALSRIQRFIT
jgi:aspartate aminotransferase